MSYITRSTRIENDGPTRSRRLRRGLVALGIAVALPGAFSTAQAAASVEEDSPVIAYDASFELPDRDATAEDGSRTVGEGSVQARHLRLRKCTYGGVGYSSGSWLQQGSHETYCYDGNWYTVMN